LEKRNLQEKKERSKKGRFLGTWAAKKQVIGGTTLTNEGRKRYANGPWEGLLPVGELGKQ